MPSEAKTQIDFGARSDPGQVRENNEDSFAHDPDMNLFVLSDGMGGYASGEIASGIATTTIVSHVRSNPGNRECHDAKSSLAFLVEAIQAANAAIRESARRNPLQHGMGATVVAALFASDRVLLAHVGDSRAYRLRRGTLGQLTRDHSFVAEQVRERIITENESRSSNMQNVLLRALGIDESVEVETGEEIFLDGDTLLLCSDGLTRELSDTQIAGVLQETDDAEEAAGRLVDLANQAGGADNITVLVLRRAATPAGAFARIEKWLKRTGTPS